MTTTMEAPPTPAPAPEEFTMAKRNERQRDIAPVEKMGDKELLIIGVGAVGRQAAIMAAAMGVPHVTVIDHDNVELVNIAAQGFKESDIGMSKVDAVKKEIDSMTTVSKCCEVRTFNSRFQVSEINDYKGNRELIVFCCVDSITTRSLIWEALKKQCVFWCDARMLATQCTILASDEPAKDTAYADTLFAEEEAVPVACTAKSTIFMSNITAGAMMLQLTGWLKHGMLVEPHFSINGLSFTMYVPKFHKTDASPAPVIPGAAHAAPATPSRTPETPAPKSKVKVVGKEKLVSSRPR